MFIQTKVQQGAKVFEFINIKFNLIKFIVTYFMCRENVFVDKADFFIYNCVCNNLIKGAGNEKNISTKEASTQ